MGESVWSEQELVRRCKEGSEAAYAELVARHGRRLFTLAYRLTGSREAAEDVVQETFLAAFRSMERFEPRPSLSPWLTTIAVRFASKTVSRTSRPASLDRMLDPDLPPDPDALGIASTELDPHLAAEAAEIRAEVQRAIEVLPFRQRTAVVLRLVLGLDYADAARAMDVPLNTFKSLLLRGTRQLRETLADRLEEAPGEGTSGGNGSSGAESRDRIAVSVQRSGSGRFDTRPLAPEPEQSAVVSASD